MISPQVNLNREPKFNPSKEIIGLPEDSILMAGVLDILKTKMTQPSFETWITPLHLSHLDVQEEQKVVLTTDSSFNRDWVLKNYRVEIQDAFKAITQLDLELVIDVQENSGQGNKSDSENSALPHQESYLDGQTEIEAEKKSFRPWTPRTTQSNLNPKYIFENFVVGQHNRFCHAAALAVAETPAQSYNPFFIYGGVGLGKTHLMQAIGHFVLRHHPDLTVKYVTAESFTNDLIGALGRKDMKPFRDRYRKIDILILDDVQFLEGKERTQEEIFHTFNTLHESGKQIILSSDKTPKQLARLEDRLRSRFEWGLIADIQPPDLETRVAILQKKAERDCLEISQDILTYIAEIHPNNIRELEGALNKVSAYAMLTRTNLNMVTVQSVLGTRVNHANISLDHILETVSEYYHLRTADLKSNSRAKDISHARQVGIYVIRTLTEASFPKIGEILGGRKHTTILYAFEKIKEEKENHPVMAQQIQEIIRRIESRSC
ncbi:MAG: chromosomal replication initiator protein DnaA [Cyanobacteria bacterium]|nr:chromosomal replication initiator protein DnaA [Cyanobacteriota bacterium]